jgi:acyl-CoA thioester hydrolase
MSGRPPRAAAAVLAQTFAVWVPVAVRYRDLDPQGHVNNAVYFTYFEQGRLGYFEALRQLGRAALAAGAAAAPVTARTLEVAPADTDDRLELPLVISEANCAYLRPIVSLAPLVVGVRTERVGHASLAMAYALCPAPGEPPYATGATMIVCVDPTTGRPRGLPAWTLAAVRHLEPDLRIRGGGAQG